MFQSGRFPHTNVRKQDLLIFSYFTIIPGGQACGGPDAGENKNNANSTQLSCTGAWYELGNIYLDFNLVTTICITTLKRPPIC